MDKARRRELRDQYKRSERDARVALCALTEEQLSDLVDATDELVVEQGCFHDTRYAEQWAERNGIAPDFFLPVSGSWGATATARSS